MTALEKANIIHMARAAARDEDLLPMIRKHPCRTTADYAELCGISWHTIRPRIIRLQRAGLIIGRKGPRGFAYQAVDQESLLITALEKIKTIQPRALAQIRAEDLVFDDQPAQDAQKWKNVAFWLYSYVCEADGVAREATANHAESEASK